MWQGVVECEFRACPEAALVVIAFISYCSDVAWQGEFKVCLAEIHPGHIAGKKQRVVHFPVSAVMFPMTGGNGVAPFEGYVRAYVGLKERCVVASGITIKSDYVIGTYAHAYGRVPVAESISDRVSFEFEPGTVKLIKEGLPCRERCLDLLFPL